MEWISIKKAKPNICENSLDVVVVSDGERYTVKPACHLYYKGSPKDGGKLFAPAFGGTGMEVKWWFALDEIKAK